MTTTAPGFFLQLVRLVVRRRWWIITPTVLCTLCALIVSTVRSRNWNATQTLIVRDEASRNGQRSLGRFESMDAMKTAQETILEIARNNKSVVAALKSIGPPVRSANDSAWPDRDSISTAQNRIQVRAPNGAEFGKTEVILVTVEAETRERAVAFVAAICEQLQRGMSELRAKRLQSIVGELENHFELSQLDLEVATTALENLEKQFGSDLAELRLLSQTGAGDSNLRSQQSTLQKDLRDAEAVRDRYEQQQELLRTGIEDPNRLIATPSTLLESQPGLRRMRDDLASAQRACAELEGTLKPQHPRLQTAMLAEREVRANLQAELQVALRGVESDLKLSTQRLEALRGQLADLNQRLDRIAGARARYSNLANEVQNCAQVVEKNKKELADARASQSSAGTANFLTQLDPPVPGDYPVGPGRFALILSGMLGGFATGCGILFLFTPLGQSSLRKWGDYLPFGRRSSDRALTVELSTPIPGGRRECDPPTPIAVDSGRETAEGKSTSVVFERRKNPDPRAIPQLVCYVSGTCAPSIAIPASVSATTYASHGSAG